MQDIKELQHAEWLCRMTTLVDDIKSIKNNQWQTTYYNLLLSGGLFAFLKLDDHFWCNENIKTFLPFIVIILSFLQIVALIFFQCSFAFSLNRYRGLGDKYDDELDKITKLRDKFRKHLLCKDQ